MTNEPAFPVTIFGADQSYEVRVGLTMRDYFAAKAMQGFIANIGIVGGQAPSDDDIARYSYNLADAMLEARGEMK